MKGGRGRTGDGREQHGDEGEEEVGRRAHGGGGGGSVGGYEALAWVMSGAGSNDKGETVNTDASKMLRR